MSPRTTVLLLLLVLGTGVFLWRDAESRQLIVALVTGEQVVPTPQVVTPLVALPPAEVVGLEVRVDARHFVMKRRGDGWDGPLKDAAVEDFLANVAGVGRLDHIGVGDRDLAEFGLESPQRSVVLVPRSPAEPIRIDVGTSNPAMTAVYVRVNQIGPIVLAGAVLAWELDKLAERLAARDEAAE